MVSTGTRHPVYLPERAVTGPGWESFPARDKSPGRSGTQQAENFRMNLIIPFQYYPVENSDPSPRLITQLMCDKNTRTAFHDKDHTGCLKSRASYPVLLYEVLKPFILPFDLFQYGRDLPKQAPFQQNAGCGS